jgi:5-methylcytosine-specific restriction endonuclease McrA
MKFLQARRLRLNPAAYRRLCAKILERDGWKCQYCGSSQHLEVHHICFRSRLGEDNQENLITICASCHNDVHQMGQ